MQLKRWNILKYIVANDMIMEQNFKGNRWKRNISKQNHKSSDGIYMLGLNTTTGKSRD